MSSPAQVTVQSENAEASGVTALSDHGMEAGRATSPSFATTEWTEIPLNLKATGFTVFYERISYDPTNPLWRAKGRRGEQEWNTLGSDLKSALVELRRQTQEPKRD